MCESNRRIQARRNCATTQCDLGTRAEQSAIETLTSPITDLDNRTRERKCILPLAHVRPSRCIGSKWTEILCGNVPNDTESNLELGRKYGEACTVELRDRGRVRGNRGVVPEKAKASTVVFRSIMFVIIRMRVYRADLGHTGRASGVPHRRGEKQQSELWRRSRNTDSCSPRDPRNQNAGE